MSEPQTLIEVLLEHHRAIAQGAATAEAVAAELGKDPDIPLTETGAAMLLGLSEPDLRAAKRTLGRDWFVLQAFLGTAD
jgi:uncharacterized protein (DUF2345 family)